MEETKNNMMHWLIGGALLLIGALVIIALVIVYSQADSVTTTTSITNADPTITSVYSSNETSGGSDDFGSGVDLVAGTGDSVFVNGVVTDTNGADDIASVDLFLYRSGTTCTGPGDADSNFCYVTQDCTLGANDATSKTYDCQADLDYWADATGAGGTYAAGNWVAKIVVTDDSSATATNTSNTFEVNNTVGLTIPAAIAYGEMALNSTSSAATNEEMVITQQGNDVADVNVSGTAMTCDEIGTIPVGNQEWGLTDFDHDAGSDLTGSAVDTNLAVPVKESSDTTKTLYWSIAIPASGVAGTCTGSNTITALAN